MDKVIANPPSPGKQEYDPAYEDPIVAEVRRIREEILASYGYDRDRLDEDVRKAQRAHPEKYVSFNRKRSEKV